MKKQDDQHLTAQSQPNKGEHCSKSNSNSIPMPPNHQSMRCTMYSEFYTVSQSSTKSAIMDTRMSAMALHCQWIMEGWCHGKFPTLLDRQLCLFMEIFSMRLWIQPVIYCTSWWQLCKHMGCVILNFARTTNGNRISFRRYDTSTDYFPADHLHYFMHTIEYLLFLPYSRCMEKLALRQLFLQELPLCGTDPCMDTSLNIIS